MSYSYNHVTLVGRLVKDPELKELASGVQKASFSLAVNRFYRKEDGTTDTDFVPIILWGKQAELSAQLLRRGAPALVWGKIQVSRYEKNNEYRWITEIVGENFQILERLNKSNDVLLESDSEKMPKKKEVVKAK